MSVDESTMHNDTEELPGTAARLGDAINRCWKDRESLWIGLIIFLLGVIGQILLYVVPSEEFATNSSYQDYQMIGSLRVMAEAAMYLGVVWAGVYLARWGIRRVKRS